MLNDKWNNGNRSDVAEKMYMRDCKIKLAEKVQFI